MTDDFVWLQHPSTEGTFRCPAAAAQTWQKAGWEPCDEPPEMNPAIAERVAWQRQQEQARQAVEQPPAGDGEPGPAAAAAAASKSTSARRGGTSTSKEA